MKFALFCALILCALVVAPLACADEASKNAKVEQLLTVMNVDQQQKQMMDQMSQMVIGQVKEQMAKEGNVSPAEVAKMESRQKRLFTLIGEQTGWAKMKPVYAKAYADTFTEGEIDGMLAFFKTAAGKAMIEKQPALNQRIMASVQSQLADLMPRIEAIIKDSQ